MLKPTSEYNNKWGKKRNKKNEHVRLHLHIHVQHIKQPQSISLKFFMLFSN